VIRKKEGKYRGDVWSSGLQSSIIYSTPTKAKTRKAPKIRSTMILGSDHGYVLPPQTRARIREIQAPRKIIRPI